MPHNLFILKNYKFITFTHIIILFLLKIMIKIVCKNKLCFFTFQTSILFKKLY